MKPYTLKMHYDSDNIFENLVECPIPRVGEHVYIEEQLYIVDAVCHCLSPKGTLREMQISLKCGD